MENKRYFTTMELAKILGISQVAVFKKIKKGHIKAEKIGRNYIVQKKDINNITGNVLMEKLTENTKKEIGQGVAKIIKEYGEVLKKLGKE